MDGEHESKHIRPIKTERMIQLHEIIIDPEFQALAPTIGKAEYRQLEASILADGCRATPLGPHSDLHDGLQPSLAISHHTIR